MKFTAGYILGAGTVVVIGASFIAGASAVLKLEAKKNETLDDLKNMNAADFVMGLLKGK